MKIGQGRIGVAKIVQQKPENRSGGNLMKQARERRKALRDQHSQDQTPPQTLPGKP